jgi:hypothetical protein
MPHYKSDVADYDLLYLTQSEKGLCVRRSQEHDEFWLPKSQIEFEDREYGRGSVIRVTIPEWLAMKHDLA